MGDAVPVFDTTRYDRSYCAIVTPYKAGSLDVDYDAFRAHVRRYTTSADFRAIRGSIIANPEAGEIFYLTPEEQRRLIQIVLEERPADAPIFAGAYGVRRDEVIDAALRAKQLGVDGIFVMPPTGTMEVSSAIDGARNPEIWTHHVRAIAEATQLPLIVHPSHPRTAEWGSALPLPSVKMVLEEVPSVVGWKMIYGNSAAHFRVARFIRTLSRHVGIFNADHFSYHTAKICGLMDGAVWGSYNYLMESMAAHDLAWSRGEMEGAARIWAEQIMPLHEYVYGDSSRLHVRYKLATWIRGFIAHPFMRPPTPEPRREEALAIFDLIGRAGLSRISREEFEATLAGQKLLLAS